MDANSKKSVSRRAFTAGAAWAVPVASIVVAAPVYAASTNGLTEKAAVTPQAYYILQKVTPATCAASSKPAGGYINTFCCLRQAGYPSGGDCNQNPKSSIGIWLETAGAVTALARVESVRIVYSFPNSIAIDGAPNSSYSQASGAEQWTGATMWNGWEYTLSSDGKTLTTTYSKPTVLNTSTTANGSGTCLPGYFVNYHYTTTCPAAASTATSTKAVTYTTVNGTSTKNL